MKSALSFRLLVVVVIAALLGSLGIAAAQEGPSYEIGAPTVVSYQGHVQINGLPYTGMGYVKLAVVDGAGATSYWSNDGTSSGGSEPTAAVSLTVSAGLFNVLLGDTTVANMTELPASVFAGTDRWLRVWFSSNGTTFTLLAPDRRIAAVPFALQAADAALFGGLDSSAYQQRVSGACAVGSTIMAVSADGTVLCQLDAPLRRSAPPEANVATTVDATGQVGSFTSMTVGVDGLPVITYYDITNNDLKVLHCGDAACSSGNTVTTLDSTGAVGYGTSVTIGADGLPVVSYYDYTNGDLKVARCGNAACSSGNTITTVDATGKVGLSHSIAIGADGLPVVSYSDDTNSDLKVLHCGDAACSASNTVTTVDSAGNVGGFTSIAIGADGLPVASYYDTTNGNLKVLHCGNAACSSGNAITTVDATGYVGWYTSITIGADGLPVVSYFDDTNANLKVLHCGNAACSSGNTVTTVDATGDVGQEPSITIGADGLPVVSYYDITNADLKVLHCGNAACSSGNTSISVDATGDMGRFSAITIGADGLAVIGYRDSTNLDLKVLHCANAFCTPYFRRR